MSKKVLMLLLLCWMMVYGVVVSAEDEDEEDGGEPAVLERPIYVPVKPAFVVNYGGTGKLQYLKLEISLRVIDTNASNAARHHMPLIRDYLVTLFSSQTNEDIDSQLGKEQLRQEALKGVQDLLEEEDGEQGVTNLFFSNFVIQR